MYNGSFRSLKENNSIMGITRTNGVSEVEITPKPRTTRMFKSEQSEGLPNGNNRSRSNILQEITSFKFEGIYMSMMCLLIK